MDQPGEHVLPYGWEIVQDIKYGTFYIDHINKHTQYEPPTVEDFKTAEKVRLKHLSQYDSLNNNTDNKIVTNVNNNLKSTSIHDTYNNDDNSKKVNGDANTDDDDGVGGRITPVTFCSDLKQLRGPLVTTTLVKSPRGFGFTIIGGSDCNRSAYLQVKHLVPGGPASLNSQLAVGDVMVSVNGTNVLGYTHSQLVSLFQSIPIGASISLLVSQGYRLRRDIGESPNHHMLNTIPANAGLSTPASGVIDISAQVNIYKHKLTFVVCSYVSFLYEAVRLCLL
ncbi:unnamed protein product [Trichobilharzia regenti]|nr:unnamed protein product [Trichobilharzia regenti]